MNNKIDPLNRREEAILLLDNYDSFTYNLLHVVKELGATNIEVFRNDEISLEEVERFDKIILSPGPGIPEEAVGSEMCIRDRSRTAATHYPEICTDQKHLRSLPGTSGHR